MKNKKTPGQIVVILTVLLAILILLTVVIVNIAKVSDIKTSTSQISDRGTLGLCSGLSAYSNVIVKTILNRCNSCTITPSSVSCVCPNWGLIIPWLGLIFAIGLALIGFPEGSVLLAAIFIYPFALEVNNIMKGGFSNAAADLSQYSFMRETSIMGMLNLAQFDPILVKRDGTSDRFFYIDPVSNIQYNYDLTDSPIAAKNKDKHFLPRYLAWYWSKRYPQVSEWRLRPLIDVFVNDLLKITELNHWDSAKWNYDEVSLKVDAPNITCAAGSCPEWAVPEKGIVRVLSHVNKVEPSTIEAIIAWLKGTSTSEGFLPVKFPELITRLLNTSIYSSYITFASGTPPVCVLGWCFGEGIHDLAEIWSVIEVLRGLMLRDMELLNLPVSYRIPSINNWLPVWYNKDDHSEDIYTRLLTVLIGGNLGGKDIKGIYAWKSDLDKIAAEIRSVIPEANGHNEHGLRDPVSQCATAPCCGWDCSILCCYPGDCSFEGTFCSACDDGTPPICSIRDLYGSQPASIMCPLDDRSVDCACSCSRSSECPPACNFQGDETPAPIRAGLNEVEQASEILRDLAAALERVRIDIFNFAQAADAILNPTDLAIIALQKEAVYGWNDRNGNLNAVRVLLEGYPARADFPYIKESYTTDGLGLGYGFWKKWENKGKLSGNVAVTVSRYSSDVSVGQWWDLRFRMNPGGAEWDRNTLSGVIDGIQQTGNLNISNADWDTYAVTSKTRGQFGMRKTETFISREK